jgi:glycine/D-amino acid oxidase-like deaminating enzyme
MIDRALEYMPGLVNLSVLRAWTGFRAAAPDKLPLIGPAAGLSDDSTLWIAVGFEGLGITIAPGAARLLVDAMTGQASAIDPSPYLPSRFGDGARQANA